MLELVSELSYLKLVSSINITNGKNQNGNNNNNGINKNGTDCSHLQDANNTSDSSNATTNNENTADSFATIARCKCINSATTNCKPYIFEKVDYIKKISIRRKAFKKLRKAKNKSRVISPNTAEP